MGQFAPCRMRLKQVDNPWLSRLMLAYNQKDHPIHSMYEYNPFDENDYKNRLKYLEEREDLARREELTRILRSYHTPELLHPAVESNLERLRKPGTLVVIGGQQAGLMTGPLYTIMKAVALIHLARKEEKRLGRPVVPVFWIAGEDHDLDEVDHIWVQDAQAHPIRHRLPYDQKGKYPISSLKITPQQLHGWLDELSLILPDSEFKEEWLSQCKQLISEPVSWSRYFARLMHFLFGKWGLLLIDASYPDLRQFEKPFFQQLIKKSREVNQKVMAASSALEQMGYDTSVEMHEQKMNLFVQIDGERHLLYRNDDHCFTKDGFHRFTLEELLNQLEKHPEIFSNNVVTRPLMQEFLFPTLLFVGGPGEVAYWGLLKEAFRELGLKMPIVYPRPSFLIVDRRVQKRMHQFALTCSDLLTDLERKKQEWLEEQTSWTLSSLFEEMKHRVSELYQSLSQVLDEEIGMDLPVMVEKNKQKVWEQIDFLNHYAERQLALKYETELRRWDELIQSILPRKRPQERVYNILSVWNQHGIEWLDQLMEDAPAYRRNELQLIIM
ncbi:bacillithiol biosynthesis cysteine-adding enzyme BshC [Thermoflavimicrobium dichotomicum]|uniref:Putative cysteine ligase BshC n=1 Tax=Thermoflavimicrobium dichotomicum TaxID=46223 RepID=A0A1I3N7E0_9BACL|nr:bacillithiol biosynthesis cysteine-adding enzyme BshC [Thermoflavimicrobium dichotomicum]SFJ04970.1 bacillithiol biosynthesis cysteine-adding enzyme BshC [Thermoflavimicrobium dichotomicum]